MSGATRTGGRTAEKAPVVHAPLPLHSIDAAARALSEGQPLRALQWVGRSDHPHAALLKGIAYAQMGDLEAGRNALTAAAADPNAERAVRSRARAALVEIALATDTPARVALAAEESADELDALGDHRNAGLQRLVLARANVLLGKLGEARAEVERVLNGPVSPDLMAMAWHAAAEVAVRSVAATEARKALERARRALYRTPHPLLMHAVEALERELRQPVAKLQHRESLHEATLFDIEALARGDRLVVDACRRLVFAGRVTIPLARRPVLFALMLELAQAWPASVGRDSLVTAVFAARAPNASHRARLRVEMGRLRKLMDGLDAEPTSTADGYVLTSKRDVVILMPPASDELSRVVAVLGDGAAWSARSLAQHAGFSMRTAQRALGALVERGELTRNGSGKQVYYTRSGAPIASRLLLLGLAPRK